MARYRVKIGAVAGLFLAQMVYLEVSSNDPVDRYGGRQHHNVNDGPGTTA